MLADLPGQRAAIGLGHPVLGLDEVVGSDARLECLEQLGILEILDLGGLLMLSRVHASGCSPWPSNVQISTTAPPSVREYPVNSAIARPSEVRTVTRVTPLRPALAASSPSAINVSPSLAASRKTMDA